MKRFNKKKGFTLAEVLITLCIIGVVCTMTIPTLINNSLKAQTVTKLQKVYTTLSQAIKLSEIDNGPCEQWSTTAAGDYWFQLYLQNYIKKITIDTATQSGAAIVSLPDGTDLKFAKTSQIGITVYLNGYNKSKTVGKDIFCFEIDPTTHLFGPYDYGTTGTNRSKWTTGTYRCASDITNKFYCAGLIMYDNWQIKDDYPYFN